MNEKERAFNIARGQKVLRAIRATQIKELRMHSGPRLRKSKELIPRVK